MTPPDTPDRPRGPRGPGRPGGPGRPSGAGRPGGVGRGEGAGSPDRSGRPGRPDRSGGRPGDDRPRGSGRPGGERDGRGAPRRDRPQRSVEDAVDRPVFPPVQSDVQAAMLDRQARRELSGLGKDDAEFVAKHLVMASLVVDDDPALAHEHAKAALHKGSRIPVVRETMGITAYLTGDYALALRELRTHRRLSGHNTQLPMMIDAERGLGRPVRGIELARGVDRSEMSNQWVVELAIALSGCRLDLGQTEQALEELKLPQLDPSVAFRYSPDLFDAYAVVLEDLGRLDEAAVWGERATAAAAALTDRTWSDNDDVGDIVDTLADGEEDDDVPPAAKPAGKQPDSPPPTSTGPSTGPRPHPTADGPPIVAGEGTAGSGAGAGVVPSESVSSDMSETPVDANEEGK